MKWSEHLIIIALLPVKKIWESKNVNIYAKLKIYETILKLVLSFNIQNHVYWNVWNPTIYKILLSR